MLAQITPEGAAVFQHRFRRAVGSSCLSGALTVLFALPLAMLMALLTEVDARALQGDLARDLRAADAAPLRVAGYGAGTAAGNERPAHAGLRLPGSIYGLQGIVLGQVLYTAPIAYLLLANLLRYRSRSPYDAARLAGVPPLFRWSGITLPFLRKELLAAAFLVFSLSVTDYGIPLAVGGKVKTLASVMYSSVVGQLDFGRGCVIGLLLLIPALCSSVFELLARRSVGRLRRAPPGRAAGKSAPRPLGAPAVRAHGAAVRAAGAGVHGDHVHGEIPHADDADAAPSARILDAAGARGATQFRSARARHGRGRHGAHGGRRPRHRALCKPRRPLGTHALRAADGRSGAGAWSLVRAGVQGTALYGTVWILILAGVLHFFTTPYNLLYQSLQKLSSELESVGSTLGIPPLRLIFDVLLPQCAGTLADMAAYFFVSSTVTISAAALVRRLVRSVKSRLTRWGIHGTISLSPGSGSDRRTHNSFYRSAGKDPLRAKRRGTDDATLSPRPRYAASIPSAERQEG